MSHIHVGKILSAQGIRGELFVYLFAKEAAWSERWQELLLAPSESDSPLTQLKILKKRAHQKQKKPGFVMSVEGVSDRNQAETLVGMGVYIPEEFLVSQEGESIYLREVLGFEVVDQKRGSVGTVTAFAGNAMQDLLVIEHPSGESFEVPFVEPILLKIDESTKIISMDIPEGLVAGEEL